MRIVSVTLYNFRCFKSYSISFNTPITLLVGDNGIGKTSILEALHYACYMRSFKTHTPKELIQLAPEIIPEDNSLSSSGFALKLSIASDSKQCDLDTLHITFLSSPTSKKIIKLNDKTLNSYKELYQIYKVITITEDDLLLIQGNPSERRLFIDQLISLTDPTYIALLKKYRQVLNNRNALFSFHTVDSESYMLWSEQLYILAKIIQEKRKYYLNLLESQANKLAKQVFSDDYNLSIEYQAMRDYITSSVFSSFSEAFKKHPDIMHKEYKQKRSLFGAHLDDYALIFQKKISRTYASRGQQKLIVFLLKGAQLELLDSQAILLIDDFMTDFDEHKVEALIMLMSSLTTHLIITSPLYKSALVTSINKHKGQIIVMS